MGFYSTLVVSLCILLYSCENDQRGGSDDKRIPYPEGKEIPVRLEIGPSLETEVQPMSRAVNDKGHYAVKVFWKGKGINAYQPYASGLFDDISNITIGLIEGYKYRFDCSFLRNDELPYQRVVNDTAYYGLPFALKSGNNSVTEAAVTNKLKVSINPLNENYTFHQYIYEGKKQLDVNRISNYPTGKRFYGSCEFDFTVNDGQDCRIAMELCRSYYSLKFHYRLNSKKAMPKI